MWVMKKTLWIGNFQAGKTYNIIQESRARQEEAPSIISVIIAYGTNVNKFNQEIKILDAYKSDITLINSKQGLLAFKRRIQKGNLDFYKKPIVISILGHHASLEILQNIITTKCDFTFELWLDESDSYSKDFDSQKIAARKDNLVDSISKLEYHQVSEITCVTATPLTELVSCTDFDHVKEIEPIENYISLPEVLNNHTVSIHEKEIKDFNRDGTLSPTLKNFILDQNTNHPWGVTIISTASGIPTHIEQSREIAIALEESGSTDFLVVVFNSGQGDKYFDYCGSFNAKERGVRSGLTALEEMWEVAGNIEEGYNHIFVVGCAMLDRSVTVKNEVFCEITGMLFSSGKDACLAALLQRSARLCGYQKDYPLLLTDKADELYLGVEQWPEMVAITKRHLNATSRRAALLNIETKLYKNTFGRHRHNGMTNHNVANSSICQRPTRREIEELGFTVINKVKKVSSANIPKQHLEELLDKKRAQEGTELRSYILGELMPEGTRPLNAVGKSGGDVFAMNLPNHDRDDSYRDTLYFYDTIKKELRISYQPYRRHSGAFAVYNIVTEQYYGFNSKAAYSEHRK